MNLAYLNLPTTGKAEKLKSRAASTVQFGVLRKFHSVESENYYSIIRYSPSWGGLSFSLSFGVVPAGMAYK
jgi:hypothetical protein